ncbi:MAG: fumarylacetoacetate hydrolase family protein [Proteobacteria bacterium]|nr:fumarylacetoacetate hydrolase family protein [Pseudomonadota bacterium]
MADIEGVIADFLAARAEGVFFPPQWSGRLDLDQAYRVQLALVSRLEAQGITRVGWKVGLTAKVIQAQFKVFEPVFGCLLSDGVRHSGHVFEHASLIRPGFESEICVVLGEDVAAGTDLAGVSRAVARCHPALEIIETRGDFTRDLPLALADNAQQKAFVIGPGQPLGPGLDLSRVIARVAINEKEVASGSGDTVLGHPLHAVTWLAGKLAEFGERLGKGDYIMSGSFTRQFPIAPGDKVEVAFEGLGSVNASFL